jgi:hypothetical protein
MAALVSRFSVAPPLMANVRTQRTNTIKRSFRNARRVGVILLGIGGGAAAYYILHEHLGGPFMFSDPPDHPGMDPNRDFHVAAAWFVVYGTMGFVSGSIVGAGGLVGTRRGTWTGVVPAVVLIALRIWGTDSFLVSEEARYGVPAAVFLSAAGSLLLSRLVGRPGGLCEQSCEADRVKLRR